MEPELIEPAPIVVVDAGVDTSARLSAAALAATPGRVTEDLLRAVPGLMVSRHGGFGKAPQYLIRGFDAVHGADLAVTLEGVPLNEPSNVHGHGYVDLAILPADLLAGVTLRPGATSADQGAFATAGGLDLSLGRPVVGGAARAGIGTDRTGLLSGSYAGREASIAVDAGLSGGAAPARAWSQLRGAARWTRQVGAGRFDAFVLAYANAFQSPGVLRRDDVDAGRAPFWGAYANSGGGASRRLIASASWTRAAVDRDLRAQLWVDQRGLRLDQNFTGFYRDLVDGDATRQAHASTRAGGRLRGARTWGDWRWSGGLDVEGGRLSQSDRPLAVDGALGPPRLGTRAFQGEVAPWTALRWQPGAGWHVEPGLRVGVLGAWGEADRAASDTRGPEIAAVGVVVAPRLDVRWSPAPWLALSVGGGRGYRPPEVRGLGTGAAPIPTVDGVSAAIAATPDPRVGGRLEGYGSWVSNEIVFDHLSGTFAASGPTRRFGGDLGLWWRPMPALRVQADATLADGRFLDGAPIPYAPRSLVSLGAFAEAVPLGASTVTAGIRGWILGPRPLPGGFVARPTGGCDLTARVAFDRWTIDVDVDNLLGLKLPDGEFAYPSWFDTTSARSELPARHFTAGPPPSARITFGRSFP